MTLETQSPPAYLRASHWGVAALKRWGVRANTLAVLGMARSACGRPRFGETIGVGIRPEAGRGYRCHWSVAQPAGHAYGAYPVPVPRLSRSHLPVLQVLRERRRMGRGASQCEPDGNRNDSRSVRDRAARECRHLRRDRFWHKPNRARNRGRRRNGRPARAQHAGLWHRRAHADGLGAAPDSQKGRAGG